MIPQSSDIRCLQCKYPLRGLDQARCPECGKAFDPNDPLTVYSPEFRRHSRLLSFVPLMVWVGVTVGAYVSLLFLLGPPDSRYVNLVRLAPAIIIAWAARGETRRWILKSKPNPSPRSERIFTICSWIMAFTLLFLGSGGYRDWSCPHGWARGVGPFGVAYSAVGGPCRNYVPHLRSWHVTGNWYVWFDQGLGE